MTKKSSPSLLDPADETQMTALARDIKQWAMQLGFQQVGIADVDLSNDEHFLNSWLNEGLHGDMHYMEKHGSKRSRPDELEPGTLRIVSVRIDYLPNAHDMDSTLADSQQAYISRYALGRDYHKIIRNRLQKLANKITEKIGEFGYRAFTDSAPVLEKALANKAGLGWLGKHTNLISSDAGSWFFLGELFIDLPLPVDDAATDHCGTCQACIDVCPTQAIIAPNRLDARRCISYLTIEMRSTIPLEFRKMIGNRIYGCDDCQLVCPWNRFAQLSHEVDFMPRHSLDHVSLIELFSWDEEMFLERMAGSSIRRIGHECWLRNIAVALGNAETSDGVVNALQSRIGHESEIVREHVSWALQQHKVKNNI